jgi:anti-sigma factor RsiW
MNASLHLDDEIQDLLDGRLPEADRARAEAHLESCTECRARRDSLAAVRRAASRALRGGEPPARLSASIAAALDGEVEGRSRRRRTVALAAAAAVLVAIALATFLRRPDLPGAAAKDFERVARGTLALELRTEDVVALERFFGESRIPFRARVLDLGMMQYRLVGGRAQTLDGRPSALFVYRGPGDRLLVCQMYRGRMDQLPKDGQPFEHGGIAFRAFARGGSAQVFWQEGDVTCVLVAEGTIEELLPLAFAKAMKA